MMLNFLRIVATLALLVAIASNWQRIDVIHRFLAVMLFLQVLTIPILIRLREKRSGRQVDKSVVFQLAYLWVMLLAVAFTTVR